ncbi:hypothetical protein KHA90_07970 [Flavobacterium psychroterrae]|uniref:DUF4868 domain-containing protein n=1 Tax=Flavobacterium psychroterrae TaxID=2133767 RepID=A0ABS5P9H4_9FLAO|nr:hypothetical protein [Flavobacterium psychroterrae]MBS7230957.1 hypothetical protein [Flavobacterium psychroterrae]
MTIDLNDMEMLLSFAQEMADLGYKYAAFNSDDVNNSNTIEFFRDSSGAKEYCLVMTNDADYFESLPIDKLVSDLEALMQSGIDTSVNEAFDLTAFARLDREKREILDNNLNTKKMNQKNLDFLKDQLKYSGFGETLEGVLKQNLEKGDKEFKIAHEAKFGSDDVKAELHFKKSDQSDMYFFNSYKINLQKEGSKDGLEQIFYINKDNNVTMKEAYNLLEGRAVNKDLKNKEGEVYNCWMKMDLKSAADDKGNFKVNIYHQNYGYDLEATLSKYPIKELLNGEHKENLIASLKKGNVQSVNFIIDGNEKKHFIEANPQFKSINVYDGNMGRISNREGKDKKQSESESNSVSKEQKNTIEGDSDSPESVKKNNRKSKSHSI